MDLKRTHFKCDSCLKIYSIEYRVIRICDMTSMTRESCDTFVCNRFHVQLCTSCDKEKPNEKNN